MRSRQWPWYLLQFVVTMGVFGALWYGTDNKDISPAVSALIAFFVAWLATGLLARFVDWLKFRSVARSAVLDGEPVSDLDRAGRVSGHAGDSAKLVGRGRVGQDIR